MVPSGLRLCRLVFAISRKTLVGTILLAASSAFGGKEPVVTAIELYDGPNGAAYVQITNLLINGRAELRVCETGQTINKSSYGKLARAGLSTAAELQRGSDGVLLLTMNGAPTCVVPANIKLEKETLSPSELADRADLQATVIGSSVAGVTAPPPLKPGVDLVFVQAPDVELAEFLRAKRARTIAQWQDFVTHYPASPHMTQAKQSLDALLADDGNKAFQAWQKTSTDADPDYEALNKAVVRAAQLKKLAAPSPASSKLMNDVRAELDEMMGTAKSENDAYLQATASHTPGYPHLVKAETLTTHMMQMDPSLEGLQPLSATINVEAQSFNSDISAAQSLVGTQHYDDAFAKVGRYRSFDGEEPRLTAVLDAVYRYHLSRGSDALKAQKWQDAVNELEKAHAIRDTADVSRALTAAKAGLDDFNNHQAAETALQQSEDDEQNKRYIDAYEVLADLTAPQQEIVADRMQQLEPDYVKAASQKAKELQDAHTPMEGRNDEIEMQKAYDYLQKAIDLSDEDNLKLRRDLLGETISDYYVKMARRYFEKPLGSGVGLGWEYLAQAQYYKPNRDDVRDEQTKNKSMYQMHSRLSIGVEIRDQTSRRDSPLFAEQLADALATGLETSGLPVRVLRPSDHPDVEPNFKIVGDVMQHRPSLIPSVQAMDSKYRASTREIPNEDWNRANRDYETATLDLQKAQRVLEGAQARGKKKEIAEANDQVAAAQAKVEEAHRKLDSIPKTISTDVIKPYTYTRKTVTVSAIVELEFRISDSTGVTIDAPQPILKKAEKQEVLFENVKPEDTEGVKPQGTEPNELQFLTDVEIAAKETLIKEARERIQALPAKILEKARDRAKAGDTDAAAEAYILYLNSTPAAQTPERDEARKFLQDRFNLRTVVSSSL